MSDRPSIRPHQRTIVAVDVEGSSARSNVAKARLRDDMYDLLEKALVDSGITEDLREPLVDRGDGALALVHPAEHLTTSRLADTFVPTLRTRLARHNTDARHRFRLRVAIHSGDVHFDRRGTFGTDIDVTVRLLDAPEVKALLRQTTAPLVLVVSDEVHRSLVRHGDGDGFEPLVRLHVAGEAHHGWVEVPQDGREAPAGETGPTASRTSSPG